MIDKEQLSFLQKYSNRKLKIKKNEKLSYKLIRQNILDTIVENTKNCPETTFSCYTKLNFPFKICYSYQRYDLCLEKTRWLKFLYNFPLIKNKTFGFLSSSGMSSINALITVLNKLKIEKKIIITKIPYFETYNLISRFFDYFEIKQIEGKKYTENGILWIDSSSQTTFDINYKTSHRIVVIDTSCFEPSSKVLENFINKFKENSFIVLIRSHIKLDCFGLEIARLGSLVFVLPSKNKENYDLGKSIIDLSKDLIRSNGGNIEIKSIYPWLGDEDFKSLADARTKRIRKFCTEMENYLKGKLDSTKYDLITTDHKMYFFIRFLTENTKKYDNDIDNAYEYGDFLAQKAKKMRLPVRSSGSFGLNLIGFDEFAVDLDKNRTRLRVAASDLPLEKAREVADFLLEELNGE